MEIPSVVRKQATEKVVVLGIMSGTSIDSVDYSLCLAGPQSLGLLTSWQAKFPPRLRQRLHAAARGKAGSHEVGQLHHDLGRFYASHALSPGGHPKPVVAGLHGQTIFHHPSRADPATFQLGEPAYLAERLRAPVVSNFRAADIAAGGEGAPLATLFHRMVFGREGEHIAVNNLGGISNVTSLAWRTGKEPRIKAFDTGPANVLLDMAMRYWTDEKMSLDKNGAWAAQGTIYSPLVSRWLQHPYFEKRPPKSTGRELFGEPFWKTAYRQMCKAGLSKYDMLATLTAFTAHSVAISYQRHLDGLPQTVILTGGGTANPTLVKALRSALRSFLPSMRVESSEVFGWPSQSIESAAFALLAYLRIRGEPGNLPLTTGAERPVCLGQISEP